MLNQKTQLNIDDSSTVVYSETIVPGRIAMGEMFDFDVCYLKTDGTLNEKIQFRDSSLLMPKTQKIQSLAMFDTKTILTSIYVMTKKPISIDKNILAAKALSIMNSKKITSLCVHNGKDKTKTIGVVHVHNILQSNIF